MTLYIVTESWGGNDWGANSYVFESTETLNTFLANEYYDLNPSNIDEVPVYDPFKATMWTFKDDEGDIMARLDVNEYNTYASIDTID